MWIDARSVRKVAGGRWRSDVSWAAYQWPGRPSSRRRTSPFPPLTVAYMGVIVQIFPPVRDIAKVPVPAKFVPTSVCENVLVNDWLIDAP